MRAETVREWMRSTLASLSSLSTVLDQLDERSGLDHYSGTNAVLVLENINDALGHLPRDADVVWCLDTVADSATDRTYSFVSLFIAQVFSDMHSELSSDVVRPVDLARMLEALRNSNIETQATYLRQPPMVMPLLEAAAAAAAEKVEKLDYADIATRVWIAAQQALVDAADANEGRCDARAGVLLIIFAALADTYNPDNNATRISGEMLTDLVSQYPPRARRIGERYQVCFSYQASRAQVAQLRAEYESQRLQAAIMGREDMFGYANYTVVARTSAPLATIPEYAEYVLVRLDSLPELTPAQEPGGVVVRLDNFVRRSSGPIHPLVLAVTDAPGLVEEIAGFGAAVLLLRNRKMPDLLDLVRSFGAECVVLAPSSPVVAARAHDCARLAEQFGVSVVVAATSTNMQVRAVARECCQVVSSGMDASELAQLQRMRGLGAIEGLRVVTVDSAAQAAQLVEGVVTGSDASVQVLVSRDFDPAAAALLSQQIMTHAPHIRLEMIQGQQPAGTEIAVEG
ncbi:MAG: hypothetical protein SOS98_02470 [Varibaculum sp.]|nr:hypothetical protein [Varibaculum sp.]